MKKLSILPVLLLSSVLLQGAHASVDYKAERVEGMKEYKMERTQMKEEIKAKKESLTGEIKDNRSQAKENRVNFRTENKDELMTVKSSLSDKQVKELFDLKENYEASVEKLKLEIKNADENQKARSLDELNILRENQFKKISGILGESAADLLEKRKSVYEENEALRAESRSMRSEYKAERKEYIDTYKGAFIKRIGNRLDAIPTANLEKAAEKIDAMIEKIENNSKMSETAKQAKLDAVIALKEIVEDRLENDEGDEEVLETLEDLLGE